MDYPGNLRDSNVYVVVCVYVLVWRFVGMSTANMLLRAFEACCERGVACSRPYIDYVTRRNDLLSHCIRVSTRSLSFQLPSILIATL